MAMPDIGRGEGRRVVHAIADHRHLPARSLQVLDGCDFVLRRQLRLHLVHARIARDEFGGGAADRQLTSPSAFRNVAVCASMSRASGRS